MRRGGIYLVRLEDRFQARRLLEFFRVEGCCRAAFQAFPNILTKSLKLQGSELIFQFKQPQSFADNLAGRAIGTGGDLFLGSSPQDAG